MLGEAESDLDNEIHQASFKAVSDAASATAHKKFPQDPIRAVSCAAVLVARFFKQKMDNVGLNEDGETKTGGKLSSLTMIVILGNISSYMVLTLHTSTVTDLNWNTNTGLRVGIRFALGKRLLVVHILWRLT